MASQLTLHSIGYVAENKALKSRRVNCIPVEDAAGLDGESTFNPLQQTLQGTDSNGKQYDVKATQDASYDCEWLPGTSNRVTPPDVRRGELVEIWRLGDTDQYYWRCMGLRDNLRVLETVIFAFNASPKEGGKGVDITQCYFVEFSAHNKAITLGTSKANGEPFAYTMQYNTGEGTWFNMDDVGNLFELDSSDNRLQMLNADGSFVKIERKVVDIKGDEMVRITSGDSVLTLKPGMATLKSAVNKFIAGAIQFIKG
jgi:hypothetical protein